jgi:hypothetical protein
MTMRGAGAHSTLLNRWASRMMVARQRSTQSKAEAALHEKAFLTEN